MNENKAPRYPWLLPSVSVLVFVLIFWMSLIFMPQMLNGDGDLGRHITIGNYILDSGSIPTFDIFSHTMSGNFMVPHEWLSQIMFAVAYRTAILNGIAWLTAVLIAATYTITTITLRQNGVRALLALAGGIFASIVGAIHTLTRPHLFTLLLFALAILILESFRRRKKGRVLIWLLPLMIIWANTHGAFISGIILVLLYGVGAIFERQKREAGILFALLVGLVLVSLLNPVGVSLLENSFAYLQEDFLVNLTNEYRSPNFHTYSTWPFAALLLGSLGLGWLSGRKLTWTSLILLIVWTAFALYSARNIPLYGLVAVVMLTPELDGWIDEVWPWLSRFLTGTNEAAKHTWGWMWAAIVVISLIWFQVNGATLDVFRVGNKFSNERFPVEAINSVEDSLPEGKMFNEFTWGGYLLYRLWPEKEVYIDAQSDFYGEELTREFLQIAEAEPGWAEQLEHHDIQWIVLAPTRPLAPWLDESTEWEAVYRDETAVIWVRQK